LTILDWTKGQWYWERHPSDKERLRESLDRISLRELKSYIEDIGRRLDKDKELRAKEHGSSG
jgi:hypothetical protein